MRTVCLLAATGLAVACSRSPQGASEENSQADASQPDAGCYLLSGASSTNRFTIENLPADAGSLLLNLDWSVKASDATLTVANPQGNCIDFGDLPKGFGNLSAEVRDRSNQVVAAGALQVVTDTSDGGPTLVGDPLTELWLVPISGPGGFLQHCAPEADDGCSCANAPGLVVLPDTQTCSIMGSGAGCFPGLGCLSSYVPAAACKDVTPLPLHPSVDTYACLVLCDADGGCPSGLSCRSGYHALPPGQSGPANYDVCLRE